MTDQKSSYDRVIDRFFVSETQDKTSPRCWDATLRFALVYI